MSATATITTTLTDLQVTAAKLIRLLLSRRAESPGSASQPAPTPNGSGPVWDLVIDDMRARDQAGRRKYGTALQAGNGRDALVDAYQEALDLCVYLRQRIEEDRLRASGAAAFLAGRKLSCARTISDVLEGDAD